MAMASFLSVVWLSLLVETAAAAPTRVFIALDNVVGTTPPSFVAHGWEPWSATQWFASFDSDPVLRTAFAHLRGSSVRFGGITADFLGYTSNETVQPACLYSERSTFTGDECPFSTASFDALVDFLQDAGVRLLFDLNELSGRVCSQGTRDPPQWCGDEPAPWDTAPLRVLLEHIRARGLPVDFVGFELGNELFMPPHLSKATAVKDVVTLAALVEELWPGGGGAAPPRIFAPGTNDCQRDNNSEVFGGLGPRNASFSFHNYPMNTFAKKGERDLRAFVLNSTWLRTETLGAQATPCLETWEGGGYRAGGMEVAVTEAAACSGGFAPGTPTTSDFVHGFFTIAQLGQFARVGVAMVARWGVPSLFLQTKSGGATTWSAASDLFLYVVYNATVGPGVLDVNGDEASGALVYAHCAAAERFGANGTVTVFAANPSASAVALTLLRPLAEGAPPQAAAISTRPRLEYVLTPPRGNVSSRAPVLNGGGATLGLAPNGSLPPMDAVFCAAAGGGGCAETITLAPFSQSFFVLLNAQAGACTAGYA